MNPSLSSAKLRAARRASSHGGTMFVVAMTVAVLAALGVWAIQSAALEVRMAGCERQNMQTHYLAEYGILGAMQNLTSGMDSKILSIACNGDPVSGNHEACLSAPWNTADPLAQPPGKTCHRWPSAAAINQFYLPNGPAALDAADGGVPGSLGPTSMQGDFNVELTEVAQGPAMQGNSMGQNTYTYWVTLQADGKTQQALSPSSNYTAYYGSEGDELLRSRVRVGPTSQVVGCK
jgi:hypothetical protein